MDWCARISRCTTGGGETKRWQFERFAAGVSQRTLCFRGAIGVRERDRPAQGRPARPGPLPPPEQAFPARTRPLDLIRHPSGYSISPVPGLFLTAVSHPLPPTRRRLSPDSDPPPSSPIPLSDSPVCVPDVEPARFLTTAIADVAGPLTIWCRDPRETGDRPHEKRRGCPILLGPRNAVVVSARDVNAVPQRPVEPLVLRERRRK